jgi:hypothetical protein
MMLRLSARPIGGAPRSSRGKEGGYRIRSHARIFSWWVCPGVRSPQEGGLRSSPVNHKISHLCRSLSGHQETFRVPSCPAEFLLRTPHLLRTSAPPSRGAFDDRRRGHCPARYPGLEAAGDRLAERGVSDADIGRALVAAGLSRWSRAVGAEVLVQELSRLTAGVASVVLSNIEDPSAPPSPLH